MSQKVWKYLKVLLILGSLFAAVKLIFVDYTMDEEYQINTYNKGYYDP